MRKSLHVGTKADVAKRKFIQQLADAMKQPKPERRIVTFNHPWVNQ